VNTACRLSGQEGHLVADGTDRTTVTALHALRQPWRMAGAGITVDDRHPARQRIGARLHVSRQDHARRTDKNGEAKGKR
jgi:hypothetical protein